MKGAAYLILWPVFLFVLFLMAGPKYFLPQHSCLKIDEVLVIKKTMAARVTVTAYAIDHRQTDDTPNITATMEKPIPGKTCAVSRDLAKEGWLGRVIWIEGLGVWKVNDVMAPRWRMRIDLCLPRKKAKKFGMVKNTAVVIQ